MQRSPVPPTTTRVENNPPVVTETGDAAGNNTTSATMSVGDQFRGTLSPTGDIDWIRINLVAGQTYRISLDGFGQNSLSDPFLTIFDSQFTTVAFDDDGGPGTNSLITFTAGYTGTYFIDVDSYENSLAGGYVLAVQQSILPSPNEVWTLDQIADQLTDGYWNSDGDTARAFDLSGGRVITVNFTQLGNNQEYIGYAQRALQLWSDATGITFTTTTSSNAGIYFTSNEDGAFSWSETVSSGQNATITQSQVNVQLNWADADYTFSTFVHEVGHALGLGHAGNYNGFANYATDRLYLNDSYQASIMSYFDQTDNTYIASIASFAEPLTPMLADIIAIRNIYGATFTTRTGNDTYGFNSTLGVGFNAAALNGPSDYTLTIIDDGGTDTVDLSGSIFNNRIDLTPLAASNTAGLLGNLFFAPGTIIENIIGGSGNDTVIGNTANNTLTANAGNDSLNGMAGNDTLIGGAGNDSLDGGNGTDFAFYDVLLADITVVYNAANDSFTVSSASSGVDLLIWIEFLRLRDVQTFSLDSYRAPITSAGDDSWTGDANDDVIDGLAGNDSLNGLAGNDQITGGTGNDTLNGGDGNDTLIGGLDVDTASYAGASSVVVNLATTTVQATGGAGNDILNGIENLIGSGFDDRLTGTSAANHIQGGAGSDVINGAGGNDTLLGGADNDLFILSVVADLGATEQIWGDTGTDTLRLITTAASTLTLTAGVNVERVEIGTGTAVAAVMGATTAINVDGAALQQAVTIVGNAGANGLTGGLGADSLDGGAGNDVLIGGLGNDTLNGNAGTDTASYATATENLVLSLAVTTGQSAGSFGTDTFLGIESLITGAGNDSLTGNASANVLTGGAGNDTLTGGAGNDIIAGGEGLDTASYFGSAAVRINLALSTAQATAGAGTDTLTGIENLIGTAGHDTLTGSTAANRIDGGAGNDVINGGAGADTLIGGEGSDLFIISAAADMVMGEQIIGAGDELRFIATTASTLTLSSEISVARVVVGTGTAVAAGTTGTTAINIDGAAVTGNQTMIGNAGANRLTGGIGADSLLGGGGADTLIGGGGADTLIGGAGLDRLTGGAGADVFVFNAPLGTANRDTITDYNVADDTIHLAQSVMRALALGQLAEAAFWTAGSGDSLSATDRILYDPTTGVLSYDADGTGRGAMVQIAQMSTGLRLTHLDFWVI